MKKVNKVIAILMCMSMFFSVCSLMGYAFELEEDFHIEDYTVDDIMTMSNADFRELLTDFERVYDPFETYETDPITGIYDENNNSNTVQPRWTSGNINIAGEYTETGSHELITMRACGVLLNDKGFWGASEEASILLILTISLASMLPDTKYTLGAGQLFAGHFYDPDTERNWALSKSNTAKTNANDNYENACDEYDTNGISEDFIEYVGKMLHYIQDACEPHHASNITALEEGSHTSFENFVDERINTYIDSYTTISSSTYNSKSSMTVSQLVHEAALLAKGDIMYIIDHDADEEDWDYAGYRTARNAVLYSAIVLYKLSMELDISLTK